MIEIFKTNVQEPKIVNSIIAQLLEHFPNAKINFDLEDCDKILRVEIEGDFNPVLVNNIVTEQGHLCDILTD